MPTNRMAESVATNVAIKMGMNTSVGLVEPMMARWAMMLMGMMVMPAVFKARNMICALEAVSLSGLISWRLCMAFNPMGVAALSSPNIVAEKFMSNCPLAGWFFGISGKSLLKNGPTIRERKRMAPAFSPMFRMPANGRAITMTAFLADSKLADMMRSKMV